MAGRGLFELAESSLKFVVLSLFLRYVSSNSCTAPYSGICTCDVTVVSCISANLTEFPSDLPNHDNLQTIDLSNNTITAIDTDVLAEYAQLKTVILVGNGLRSIIEQSLPVNFTEIDLSANSIDCDDRLAWLTPVASVLGKCATGEDISSFLETLRTTAAAPVGSVTQQNATGDGPTQPTTDAQPQPESTPMAGNATSPQPESNKLYVLAIIIPVLVIVVIIIAVVIFTRKNRKQQEACNSAIRYSVVRKEAGAGNRVYSDVTTEL